VASCQVIGDDSILDLILEEMAAQDAAEDKVFVDATRLSLIHVLMAHRLKKADRASNYRWKKAQKIKNARRKARHDLLQFHRANLLRAMQSPAQRLVDVLAARRDQIQREIDFAKKLKTPKILQVLLMDHNGVMVPIPGFLVDASVDYGLDSHSLKLRIRGVSTGANWEKCLDMLAGK